jgi:hypothetical protein
MSDAMKRYTSIAPVIIEDWPDAHHVFFHATNQRFCVTPHGCETKEEAEWMREQLCVALGKVVTDSDLAAKSIRLGEWHPIETAPKDERIRIRVWADDAEWHATWDRDIHKINPRPFWNIHGMSKRYSRNRQPTHWQPVSPPPEGL